MGKILNIKFVKIFGKNKNIINIILFLILKYFIGKSVLFRNYFCIINLKN